MMPALVVLVLASGWRVLAAYVAELGNFSPLMALVFCGGVYVRDRRLWLVPFAALVLSDLIINHSYAVRYHYAWSPGGLALRMLCFAGGLGLGLLVARRRTWLTLAGGSLASSLLFYLVTNTAAWFASDGGPTPYARSLAGWWQALTVGHPGYPSTLFFFRNTLTSDLLFTAVFVVAMETAASRRGAPSLLPAFHRSAR
jgi:hypothetical protein